MRIIKLFFFITTYTLIGAESSDIDRIYEDIKPAGVDVHARNNDGKTAIDIMKDYLRERQHQNFLQKNQTLLEAISLLEGV